MFNQIIVSVQLRHCLRLLEFSFGVFLKTEKTPAFVKKEAGAVLYR